MQQRELERVREGFAPVPVLRAPYFEAEVLGGAMLDRLGDALFARGRRRPRCCTPGSRRSSASTTAPGRCGSPVPFAGKGDVSLKKVGDELVVRVDGRKRTVVLPPALAALKPAGAALDDGALVVRFA